MTEKPKSWRDVLPIHPAAELFPLMSPDELRELGEDIKKGGLNSQIVVTKDGRQCRLLDGRNRLDAMEAVGIAFNLILTTNGSCIIDSPGRCFPDARIVDGDPYAYVVSANIHRRHLTTEQKRELIAKLLKATPEKSDRQIAKAIKASPSTVGKVRKKHEEAGDVSKLDTRTDSSGRNQQAHKPTGKSPAVMAAVKRAIARSEENQRLQAGNSVDPVASAEQRKAAAAREEQPITPPGLVIADDLPDDVKESYADLLAEADELPSRIDDLRSRIDEELMSSPTFDDLAYRLGALEAFIEVVEGMWERTIAKRAARRPAIETVTAEASRTAGE